MQRYATRRVRGCKKKWPGRSRLRLCTETNRPQASEARKFALRHCRRPTVTPEYTALVPYKIPECKCGLEQAFQQAGQGINRDTTRVVGQSLGIHFSGNRLHLLGGGDANIPKTPRTLQLIQHLP